MANKEHDYNRLITIGIRMVARFLGSILFLMIIMFAIGEGLPNPLTLSIKEGTTFFTFVVMLSGLVIAWKWEGIGGLTVLCGYILFLIINPHSMALGVITMFPVTGLLFLLYWTRARRLTAKPDLKH